jgi:hypothetical protein
MKKVFVVFTLALLMVLPMLSFMAMPAQAQTDELFWDNQRTNIQGTTGLGDREPQEIAASVIRILLGFLGIIAVAIILIGGFKWMTAGGNEDKVGEAKRMIAAGIIGLLIILAAFGIATFVINQFYDATT